MEKRLVLTASLGISILLLIVSNVFAIPFYTCLPESTDPLCSSEFVLKQTTSKYTLKFIQYLRCRDEPSSPYCISTQTIICGWLLYGERYDVSYCRVLKEVDGKWEVVTELKPGDQYRIPANSGINWKYEGYVEVVEQKREETKPVTGVEDVLTKILIIVVSAFLIYKGLK